MKRLRRQWRLGISIVFWVALTVAFYLAEGLITWPERSDTNQHLDYSSRFRFEARLALAVLAAWLVIVRWWGEPTAGHIGLPSIHGHEKRFFADVGFGLLLGPAALGAVLITGL